MDNNEKKVQYYKDAKGTGVGSSIIFMGIMVIFMIILGFIIH